MTGHVEWIMVGEIHVLVGKPVEKKQLVRPKCRCDGWMVLRERDAHSLRTSHCPHHPLYNCVCMFSAFFWDCLTLEDGTDVVPKRR
jgi:hypothetical protein